MSATKKGFSCLEFQRQLGLSRYETAFSLMHKIRVVMGKRDAMYMLKGMILEKNVGNDEVIFYRYKEKIHVIKT
jgi:hypothetical protein